LIPVVAALASSYPSRDENLVTLLTVILFLRPQCPLCYEILR
jgi:hypothetical protein